uniref:Lipase maturation factor n=1 Tax=Ailuropoda melanoleuca TaxID=9646 RepID=A0A7N5JCT1_AILME
MSERVSPFPVHVGPPRYPPLALTAAARRAACGGRALPAHGRGQPGRDWPPILGGASGRVALHAHAYWRPRDGGARGVAEEAEGRECGRRAWVSAGDGARPRGLFGPSPSGHFLADQDRAPEGPRFHLLRGVPGGFPSEQAADRRPGPAALPHVPEERAAVFSGPSRLGRRELRANRALAAGLVTHGLQPGRPRTSRVGRLIFRPGHRLCQYGAHGHSLGSLHVPGQRGTDLVIVLGWESQLLETGFLGIFLCPLWTLSRLPRETPPSQIVLWGFRWLIFRIMLGATQPVPNPVAYFLHRSPWWVHRFETLSNHFLELVVPFFIFLGRQMCALHGALQILFQVVLIISGNLSFLNWLTMVPSVACFDDATLGFLFPSGPGALKDRVLKLQEETARGARPTLRYGCMVRRAVHVALGVLVAWLSVPVVINLLSPTQVMNTSFNPLRIVNTYGAFGSITKERTEVILQGTASPNASLPDAVWEDYEFKCKPGDPGRRPCLISPYHHRLDWLMWFAAFQVRASPAPTLLGRCSQGCSHLGGDARSVAGGGEVTASSDTALPRPRGRGTGGIFDPPAPHPGQQAGCSAWHPGQNPNPPGPHPPPGSFPWWSLSAQAPPLRLESSECPPVTWVSPHCPDTLAQRSVGAEGQGCPHQLL